MTRNWCARQRAYDGDRGQTEMQTPTRTADSSPTSRRSVALVTAAMMLGGCGTVGGSAPVSSPSPTIEVETAAVAEYCYELDDADVLEATRIDFGQDAEPEIFDRLIAACQEAPEAEVWDVYFDARWLTTLRQSFPIKDEEGYTFDLSLDFALMSIEADPSSEPPGFTAASPKISLTMSIVNTTQGRNLEFLPIRGVTAPVGNPTFRFLAAYDAGSPVCAIVYQTDGACMWPLAFGRMNNGQTVEAGGEYSLDLRLGSPGAGGSSLLENIPEPSWDEVAEALAAPDGYRVMYEGGDMQRFSSRCALPDPSLVTSPWQPPVLVQTTACPSD